MEQAPIDTVVRDEDSSKPNEDVNYQDDTYSHMGSMQPEVLEHDCETRANDVFLVGVTDANRTGLHEEKANKLCSET